MAQARRVRLTESTNCLSRSLEGKFIFICDTCSNFVGTANGARSRRAVETLCNLASADGSRRSKWRLELLCATHEWPVRPTRLATGNSVPRSFPVRSLFRFVARTQCFRRKYALEGTYPTLVDIQVAIFPVFFPVSREFRQRRVRARLRPPPYLFSRVNPLLLVELVLCRPIETAPFIGSWATSSLWRRQTSSM